ncbi:hypothetical protein, partial [Halorhabdus salina]|uniref:hypothetical protein n=1 Tax=Halorhabdus salina TaxID=2750670 RepID=UPI001C664595
MTEITGLDRRGIKSKLEQASDKSEIEFDSSSLSGVYDSEGFETRFEWSIEKGDGAYILVEEMYIDKNWYYLVLASIVGTAISFFLLALAD